MNRYLLFCFCFLCVVIFCDGDKIPEEDKILSYMGQGQEYRNLQAFEKSEVAFQKALELSEKVKSKKYMAYCCTSLAILYGKWGRATEELENYEKSLQLKKEICKDYILTWDYSKKHFFDEGIIEEALRKKLLLSQIAEIEIEERGREWLITDENQKREYWITANGEELIVNQVQFNSDLIRGYSNLGDFYNNVSMNANAIKYYEKALRYIRYQEENKKDLELIAVVKFNVGKAYSHLSRISKDPSRYLEKAQAYLKESLVIRESLYKNYYEYFEKNERILTESEKIEIDNLLYRFAIDVSDSYASLGKIFRQITDFTSALKCYSESLRIREGFEADSLGDAYINVMNVVCDMKNFEVAFLLKEKAVAYLKEKKQSEPAIYKLNFGVLHYSYGKSLNDISKQKEEFRKASVYFDDTLRMLENNYTHTSWKAFSNASYIFFQLGENEKAWKSALKAYDIARTMLENEYIELTVREKIARVDFDFERPYSALMNIEKPDTDSLKIAYNAMVYQKELVNHIIVQQSKREKSLKTPFLQRKYAEFLEAFHQYQISLKKSEQSSNIEDLRNKYEEILKEIDRHVENFSTEFVKIPALSTKQKSVSLDVANFASDIQSKLPNNCAFVDYCSFRSFENDEILIGAFVITSKAIKLYSLGTERDVNKHIKEIVEELHQVSIKESETVKKMNSFLWESEKRLAAMSHELYKIIWFPFVEDVENAKYVFVSPHRGLHHIAFNMLSSKESPDYLIKKHVFMCVSSGKTLLKSYGQKGVGFYGVTHPDFDFNPQNVEILEGKNYLKWGILPKDEEVKNAKKSYINIFGDNVSLIHSAQEATETNFEANSVGKRFIHTHTQGFFTEAKIENHQKKFILDDTDLAKEAEYNPLQSVHLVLAKANVSVLPTARIFPTNKNLLDDGYLSAQELALLDLGGVELLILSACDLGQGKDLSGVGQYAFRWAYERSGGKYLISALWKVHNDSMNNIMMRFYKNMDRFGVWCSLHISQLNFLEKEERIRKNNSKKIAYSHPYFWAALSFQGNALPEIIGNDK